jgi:hypothetical protein
VAGVRVGKVGARSGHEVWGTRRLLGHTCEQLAGDNVAKLSSDLGLLG